MTIFSQLILFLGIPFCYLRKTRGPKTRCKCDVTVTCRNKSTSAAEIISVNTFNKSTHSILVQRATIHLRLGRISSDNP